jgi:hypothetical protein
MKHSPFWEADSNSVSQEIPCLIWNLKIHYRVHNNQPSVNPFHTLQSNSVKIHFMKKDYNTKCTGYYNAV